MPVREKPPLPKVIREVVDKIAADYRPQRIILFGSYARGEADEDSDLDLLIVKETDQRPIERWMTVKRLLRDRRRKLSVSPLVYTPRELQARLAIHDFFIRDVLAEGETVYG